MTTMFWGLRLEPGRRYSTTVDKSFHVSMAALDCSSVKNEKDVHTVMLEEGETNVPFILCNLQKTNILQCPLDLNFMSGDRVTFFCRGNGTVHLSGYIISEEDDDDDMAEFGEEGEEDEEIEDEELEESIDAIKNKLNGTTKKKRKGEGSEASVAKKKKIESDDDEESGDEEVYSDDEAEVEGEEAESDDEGSDEDDEEEESEQEEITVQQLQQQIQKTKKQKKQEQQQKNKDQAKSPGGKQQQQQKGQQSPGQQNKSPGQQSKQQKTVNGLPEQGKKMKGGQKPDGVPAKMEGGVQVQDLKVGNGPPCKPGKMVTVFYTGRLKTNNKVFDETKQGPGFKFRLGQGEVIRGWDVGLSGMKVGGKRIITCPPNMAYGSKGAPPTIPANSTLVFEVELKAVN